MALCLTGLILGAAAPIRIGSVFAETGVAAEDNRPSITGAREAVAELNRDGGVLGRKLELMVFDNLSTPIGSKLAVEQAVAAQASAIIGAAWSSHTLAMAPIAQAHRTPLITTISTHGAVTLAGDCVFRMCFLDAFQGEVMARFAREALHARTAVSVSDLASDYAADLSREFEQDFRKAGGEIVGKLRYRINQASFTELAGQVRALNPDVVFIPGYWDSAVIIKAILASGCATIPLGGDGWGTRQFYSLGGNAIPRAYFCTHWAEDSSSAKSKAFVAKYKRGAEPMDSQEALAYDAVYLLAGAIRRAGSAEREPVREAIAATRAFVGVTGRVSFQDRRDPSRSAVIVEIKDGKPHFYKSVQP
ncbi:MAG: ABC transporter substrate-binding protein [Holophaga sp.]|nr:ABC transporter substrate-binding protein [Holophaga sp.]